MAQTVALQNRPPDQPVRALQVPTHESERNEIESADPHFGCQRKARNWRFPHTKPHPPSVTAIARLAGAKPQNYQNQKAYFDVISGSWPTILKYTATFYSAWQEFYCIRTNIVLFFLYFPYALNFSEYKISRIHVFALIIRTQKRGAVLPKKESNLFLTFDAREGGWSPMRRRPFAGGGIISGGGII